MLTPIPNLGSVTWFFYISALTEVNKLDTWLLEDFVNILLLDIVNVVDAWTDFDNILPHLLASFVALMFRNGGFKGGEGIRTPINSLAALLPVFLQANA